MHRIRVEQPTVVLTTPFIDLKESLPMDMIKRIDFIPAYMAAVFGFKATDGGVLSVTTKRGDDPVDNNVPLPIQVITPLGAQMPAEFYAPKYEPGDTSGHDFRTTLYWNPDVKPGENGNTVVTFYMPDNVPAGWNIVVEGLAEDGSVIELPR